MDYIDSLDHPKLWAVYSENFSVLWTVDLLRQKPEYKPSNQASTSNFFESIKVYTFRLILNFLSRVRLS